MKNARAIRAQVIALTLVGLILFGSAGRLGIVEFWLYLSVIAAARGLELAIIDPDLTRERMRPGGQNVGPRFLPLILLLVAHWGVAGLDRGRFHISDTVPTVLEGAALLAFALAWLGFIWAMRANQYFSSIPRVQSERGHAVVSSGPYRFVRHPGYAAALVATAASGLALGSWLSTFIVPFVFVGLIRRTTVEEDMLKRELPGYANYAARIHYRLVPGIW